MATVNTGQEFLRNIRGYNMRKYLKGLSHEIDFKNVEINLRN
jgi:hypothetical protein